MLIISLLCSLLVAVAAQSTTSSSSSSSLPPSSAPPSSSSSPSISLSLTTGSITVTLPTTRPGGQATQVVTVLPAVFNVTRTITPTATSVTSATDVPTTSPSPAPIVLATRVDPAFAVLGVILILTGLPSAFWGHKNRWTSFFLIGFYTLALVCIVLILKFGVLPAINPPSKTVRGMFVLACSIAGIAGGAIAIFFWKGARYGIGAWGGFAFGLWVQCFSNGGLIKSIGFRWILYIGCGMIGFTLSTIPKIHYHVVLVSTAFVGASSFILGVDCFTTAGLKEFYIWNVGFPGLFPKFTENGIQFPVSQTMQIELGLIGAIALMGAAVQFRILKILQKKMDEIAHEAKIRDEEAEGDAAKRIASIERERDEWEKEHPTLTKHGRQDSPFSSSPLIKEREGSITPSNERDDTRLRHVSGLSDFKVAPTSDEDLKRATRHAQTPGVLPTLDLGLGIKDDVPPTFMAKDIQVTAEELEAFKRKEELLAEIQTIRRSIDVLKSETPIPPSSSEQSRRPSFSSRRTLSFGAGDVLLPAATHARPPRETDPRERIHSMDFLGRNSPFVEPAARPTSVPKETDWDAYVQERKLLQPPVGVTPPIATTSVRPPMAPAVQEALNRRKQRESMLLPDLATDSLEDVPLARMAPAKHAPTSTPVPINILPPRRSSNPVLAPDPVLPTRVRTFEELNERHREKMRDLQAPLTQAAKEHAELEAARQRWERSKALEKEAVTRRQAQKVAALEKKRYSGAPDANGRMNEARPPQQRHSRSLSADKLGRHSSKRISVLKVEDWQRYQQDADTVDQGASAGPSSKRDSRAMKGSEGVPFPGGNLRTDGRRKSKDFLS